MRWARRLRMAGAVLLVVLGAVWAAPPSFARSGPKRLPSTPPTTVQKNLPAASPHQTISVTSQTPYLDGASGTWTIGLRLAPGTGTAARLAVTVYPLLYTRTFFDQTLSGQMHGQPIYQSGAIKVASLPAASGGGVNLELPVNPSGKPPQNDPVPPLSLSVSSIGVYPVQIGLVNQNGVTMGQPITTYLVLIPHPISFPKLAVSWILPVHAKPSSASGGAGKLGTSAVSSLASLASALAAHPSVPVSLEMDPETLNALQASGSPGRTVLGALSALATDPHDQVMPSTYVPVDIGGMAAAGLGGEVANQLNAGGATLRNLVHAQPARSAWALPQPLDTAAVQLLQSQGATHLVMPGNDLQAPNYNFTFAQPAQLQSATSGVEVVGADTILNNHFSDTGDQVLQAQQFLAELAMIDSETPGQQRGVAILTPTQWTPQPAFIDQVLAGLAGNPLLQAVTVDQLFATVPPATTNGHTLVRGLSTARPAPFPLADSVRQGRSQLASFSRTFPTASQQAAALAHQLLDTEASDLTATQRAAALAAFSASMHSKMGKVAVPPDVSITLTARNGNVPVTVVDSGPRPAHVLLVLSSQKLSFRSFTLPGGRCQATRPGSAICALDLTGPTMTLKIPVEARTTGVFSLVMSIQTADGVQVLSSARYTVRSTAVSVVALVLMIGAVILLAVWWVRDRRHGRRARELVQPPQDTQDELAGDGDGPEYSPPAGADSRGQPPPADITGPANGVPRRSRVPGPPDPAPGENTAGGDHGADASGGDRLVADFFASPPPRYPGIDPPSTRAGRRR